MVSRGSNRGEGNEALSTPARMFAEKSKVSADGNKPSNGEGGGRKIPAEEAS